jgi:hypothetical protein
MNAWNNPSIDYAIYFVVTSLLIALLAKVVLSKLNRYLHLAIHLTFLHGLISVVVIESGVYISEQDNWGYLNFSALRLILYLAFFYAGWLLAESQVWNKMGASISTFRETSVWTTSAQPVKKQLWSPTLLILIFLVLWLADFIQNWPPPLLAEGLITRFVEEENRSFFTGKVFTFIPLALGYITTHSASRHVKKIATILLLTYFFLIALSGQKFGGFVFGLFYFYAARFVCRGEINMPKARDLIKLAFLAFAIIFGIVQMLLFHYETIAPGFGINAAELLLQRIFVLQGHLWFAVDRAAEILHGGDINPAINNGSFMIGMMLIAAPWVDPIAITNGIAGKFTFGFPTVIPYTVGHLFTPLILTIVGLLAGFILKTAERSTINSGLIVYLISMYAWIAIFEFLNSGDFFLLFSTKNIVVLIAFTTILLLRKVFHMRNF